MAADQLVHEVSLLGELAAVGAAPTQVVLEHEAIALADVGDVELGAQVPEEGVADLVGVGDGALDQEARESAVVVELVLEDLRTSLA